MRVIRSFYIIIAFACISNVTAQEADSLVSVDCFDCCRPDAYAPFGLMMTDHVHAKKEISFAYYFTDMQTEGNMSGTKTISNDEIFKTYMMSPGKMDMQMHMLMCMYGVSDRLTVMGMFNYMSNSMNMTMMPSAMANMPGMGMDPIMPTVSKSSGLGDTKLYALYNVLGMCNRRLVIGGGINIPTGNVNAKGATMMGYRQTLPYNMQLGSGTFGLLPVVTYIKQYRGLSIGSQAKATINLGVNSREYALGNQYGVTGWIAYEWLKWVSFSTRFEFSHTDKIYGYDPDIALFMNNDPGANTKNYGGQTATILAGLNLYTPKGRLKGNRLSVEMGAPFYQNLNGIQSSQRFVLYAGWSIAF